MDIYVYSDESGVFDVAHNKYYVFGGIMFLSEEEKNACTNKYLAAERCVKQTASMSSTDEAKASVLSNENKGKLFRSLNQQIRFGVIVDQTRVLPRIFASKKDKQRYLDYVYKIAVKRCFERLIKERRIIPSEVSELRFYVDEHSTATNGRYELREGLEREFKNGTYSPLWDYFYPPIFQNLHFVTLDFCNSRVRPLVRAADIVANRIYYLTRNEEEIPQDMYVIYQP